MRRLLLMVSDLGTRQVWAHPVMKMPHTSRARKLPSLPATHPQEGPPLLIRLKADGHEAMKSQSFLSGDF